MARSSVSGLLRSVSGGGPMIGLRGRPYCCWAGVMSEEGGAGGGCLPAGFGLSFGLGAAATWRGLDFPLDEGSACFGGEAGSDCWALATVPEKRRRATGVRQAARRQAERII